MNKSIVLLVLLVGLVGFAVIYKNNREQRMNSARLVGAPMREYLLPNLPVSEIRKIRVRDESVQVNLAVKGDRWVVEERGDYAAAYDKISRLVSDLAEVKIVGKNEVGPSALKELLLDIPVDGGDPASTGLQIELFNEKGDELGTLVLGNATKTSGGASSGNWMGGVEQRYVRIPKDQNTAWLIKDTLTEWAPQPEQWLSKAFIDVTKIKSIEVKFPEAGKSWKLERADEAGPLSLVGSNAGDTLESSITSRADYLFSNALFSDVHTKDKAGELLKEALPVTITTFEGFVYEVKVGRKFKGEDQSGEASYFVSFTINNDIPKTRTPAADEKPEDKKAKDDEFAAVVKSLEEKLKKEKAFEGWVYEMSASTVDLLFKERSALLAPKEQSPEQNPSANPNGQVPMPSLFNNTPAPAATSGQ